MEMVEYIEVDELSRMIRGSVIKKYPLSFSSGISASSDELEKLPAADVSTVRHGRWIPVTERLPEKDDRFICTYKFNSNSEMQFVSVLYYYASDQYPHWQHESAGVIVTHWMPLPEPPKEGAEV